MANGEDGACNDAKTLVIVAAGVCNSWPGSNVLEIVCAHHDLREGSDFQAPRCGEMLLGPRLPHLGKWRCRDVALDGEWSHPGHSLHVHAIFRSPRKDAEVPMFSFLPKLGRSTATDRV